MIPSIDLNLGMCAFLQEHHEEIIFVNGALVLVRIVEKENQI